MHSMDEFRNKVGRNFVGESSIEEGTPAFSVVGDEAQQYIEDIYTNGAEEVLNHILSTVISGPPPTPVEAHPTNYESFKHDGNVIIWSKSGQDPFVSVYTQDIQEDVTMEDFLTPETNIDREAVESAGYFMGRGIAEDTFNSLVDEACGDVTTTEEAITKLQELMKNDETVSKKMFTDEEKDMYDGFRHSLREKMLGLVSNDLLPEYKDYDKKNLMPGLKDPISMDEPIEPFSFWDEPQMDTDAANAEGQTDESMYNDGMEVNVTEVDAGGMAQQEMANLQKEQMDLEQQKSELMGEVGEIDQKLADINQQMQDASKDMDKTSLGAKTPTDGVAPAMGGLLQETSDEIDKPAVIGAYMSGGAQNFANQISQLSPDQFQLFLQGIDKEALNILGSAASGNLAQQGGVDNTAVSPEVSNAELTTEPPPEVSAAPAAPAAPADQQKLSGLKI